MRKVYSCFYICVCTTGAVASMFWVDAELGSDLYLDGKMLIFTHGYVFLPPNSVLFICLINI